jgi:hypothetical protein
LCIQKRLEHGFDKTFRAVSSAYKRHLDVDHPEMTWLTRMALLVARPVADPMKDIPERYDSVSPLHILRLESLVAA